ncbi:MAG: lipoyl synthase [Thermacetogeniaceae bacterium]
MASHFPSWLHKKLPPVGKMIATEEILNRYDLHTICESAMCPNQGECLAAGTATFLILGDRCTRNCRFCAVTKGVPLPSDPGEPEKLARVAAALELRHVVVTSVTRDDLPDGGAGHFAATIQAVRRWLPEATIEVLTPDFQGVERSIDIVITANPDVFNHNIETVERLYTVVRPGANYRRSLDLLKYVKEKAPGIYTKSGLMVGLGEKFYEVVAVMEDLRHAGCDVLTVGQYLRPSPQHLPIRRFVPPEEFDAFKERALQIGFLHVESGPLVRSSYRAQQLWHHCDDRNQGRKETVS